ncbi:MAG: aminopeptidase P N-terminal domain-containing protein, partial [Nannocystaceae bacterium]
MQPPRTVPSDYAARRARVAARLPSDAALVLSGGGLHTRSNDTEHRFRPDSNFFYLTGLSEPGAVLFLRGGSTPHATLFVREKDRAAEIWSGRRPGPEGAKLLTEVEEVHTLASLKPMLPKLLDGVREVHLPLHRDRTLHDQVLRASREVARRDRRGATFPTRLADADAVMGEERLVKDSPAMESLRHAISLSALAHREAAAHLRPGQHEYEFEARLEYVFRRHGSSGPGYGSIVGAGDNANILHYVDNADPIGEGELVLVDAGCEWDLFTGDITRCYPASGRFSAPQRALYEVVLAANVAGIEASVVGGDVNAIHERCLEVLVDGMLDLGLLKGNRAAAVERETYKQFYMHRTSHWLG